jgi:AhpD family alkylhydroperoxidase
MSNNSVDQFQNERRELNELVLQFAGKHIKRFYALDNQVYQPGALPALTKELLGLVASLVLRCDDCVKYHLTQCHQLRLSDAELEEALSVGLIVGGSIVIPHLRRAIKFWEELQHQGAL